MNFSSQKTNFEAPNVLGGPDIAQAETLGITDNAAFDVVSDLGSDFPIATDQENVAGYIFADSAAILNSGSSLGDLLPNRDNLLTYKVVAGDTLSGIAVKFGISLDTILSANSGLKVSSIKPGQEIVVLPVSGVVHVVQDGDTLGSISALYKIDQNKIVNFNQNIKSGVLTVGTKLVIPGAKSITTPTYQAETYQLPTLANFFAIPTKGWNWGQLHSYNAVDIANSCGSPIYAAAEGLVIHVGSPYQWNGGYGGFIDIQHPTALSANVYTKYAHTQENFVAVGDYVRQGDLIAYIGNTGKTHGITGCHLHFEVHGAKNPFAK